MVCSQNLLPISEARCCAMSSPDIYGKAGYRCSDLTNKWRMCELLKGDTDKTAVVVSHSVKSSDSL